MQVNRERVGTFVLGCEGGYRDVAMLQDCDSAVDSICGLCGWTDDFRRLTQQAVCKTTTKRQDQISHKPTHKTQHKHTNSKKKQSS